MQYLLCTRGVISLSCSHLHLGTICALSRQNIFILCSLVFARQQCAGLVRAKHSLCHFIWAVVAAVCRSVTEFTVQSVFEQSMHQKLSVLNHAWVSSTPRPLACCKVVVHFDRFSAFRHISVCSLAHISVHTLSKACTICASCQLPWLSPCPGLHSASASTDCMLCAFFKIICIWQ